MLETILGLIIIAIFGMAIIAPVIALILKRFTKKSFKEWWRITSIAVLIIVSLLAVMVFFCEFGGSFSLISKHSLIAVGIMLTGVLICLYLLIKKTFKKRWATISLYLIGLLLLISVPILIVSSDLNATVFWQFGAGAFMILLLSLLIIAPVIGLFIRLLNYDTFINGWKLGSIILTVIVLLFSTPVLIIKYTTEKPRVEQLDQQYAERKDNLPEEESSVDKILVDIYKDGNFKRTGRAGRRHSSPSANFILKNYNDEEFRGTITVQAVLNGEKIGEKEVKIYALPNSEDSNSISTNKLNITKKIWDDVEFDYTIDGEFVRH